MPQITLTQDWTDPKGTVHHAGEVVVVDDATAEQLAHQGVTNWNGPTVKFPGAGTDGWNGPT